MKFDISEIKNITIKLDSSIKDVISNINASSLKIALVIDSNNKLHGTIVDGDIRRGLLDGLNLKDKIEKIVNKKPMVARENMSTYEAIDDQLNIPNLIPRTTYSYCYLANTQKQ